MRERPILITNNDKAIKLCEKKMDCLFLPNEGYLQVLYKARDYIHRGHKLLSHPMAGSLKPNQTPYKSVILEGAVGNRKETMESVMLIENSIGAACKFLNSKPTPNWPEKIRDDFQIVDLSFIRNYVEKLAEK